jgi:hypothetical protein
MVPRIAVMGTNRGLRQDFSQVFTAVSNVFGIASYVKLGNLWGVLTKMMVLQWAEKSQF